MSQERRKVPTSFNRAGTNFEDLRRCTDHDPDHWLIPMECLGTKDTSSIPLKNTPTTFSRPVQTTRQTSSRPGPLSLVFPQRWTCTTIVQNRLLIDMNGVLLPCVMSVELFLLARADLDIFSRDSVFLTDYETLK